MPDKSCSVKRHIGANGPTTGELSADQVSFLQSTATLTEARQTKKNLLEALDPATRQAAEIVIFFRRFHQASGTSLCQVDPFPESNSPVGCDLFLVPKTLLKPENRADFNHKVTQILDNFAHFRPPTAAEP